ncbi:MAG TPA: ABC transporter permease [Actinomycetota bacterium]|jgi:ABC-2 type transport system permease protein|nr:ABC transporter permease [Actinomycetota bacterium]
MAADAEVAVRTSEASHLRIAARVREVASRRETLLNLVRKELKVKYAQSVLGAIWSLLNPIVFLAVFSFVMRITNNQFSDYPVYLLSGLLAWNLCSVSLTTGARSVIDNANLVKKVAFPREILPLSAIGVALVDFVLQSAVLFLFIPASGHGFHLPELVIYPLAFVTLIVFTTAMTLWLAALNVRYRDIQHLLNIGLLVWFWFTPIVYSGYLVKDVLTRHPVLGVNLWNLFLVNPLTPIVMGFQRALYATVRPPGSPKPVLPDVGLAWLAGVLALVLVVSLAFLRLTWGTFFRLSGDFAEEL